jgi:hypothetical protein
MRLEPYRRDRDAVTGSDAEEHLESVKTARTNDEVAAGVRPNRRRRQPTVVAA